MTFAQTIIFVMSMHLVAVSIPGPDFFCVSQSSVNHGKKAGILAALGISLGLAVHIIAAVIGLTALMANPAILFVIKIIAGLYLIYLGWQCLKSKPNTDPVNVSAEVNQYQFSVWQVMQRGFWCNVLNPKVPIYFLSVFTVAVPAETPVSQISILGGLMMLFTFAWFAMVAIVFATPYIQRQFRKMGHWLDRLAGVLFMGFGLKVLLSSNSSS